VDTFHCCREAGNDPLKNWQPQSLLRLGKVVCKLIQVKNKEYMRGWYLSKILSAFGLISIFFFFFNFIVTILTPICRELMTGEA
jgi:hypothetical protein